MSDSALHSHDGTLTDALAGILTRLRDHPYRMLQTDFEAALRDAADDFIAKLAAHLRHEEEILFPALRELVPWSERELDALEEEHRSLRVFSRSLALRITTRDEEGIRAVGRTFLAALLDHVERETAAVDRAVGSLNADEAVRFAEIINAREAAAKSRADEAANPPGRC
jgi:hemerythrin-like domain-containing protein